MTNTPQDQKVNFYEVFKHAKDEKHAFLTADLLFGSAALWIPLLLGLLFISKTTPWNQIVILLDSGAAYTFSLAYLAAGSSFLYLDRRKKAINDFRDEVYPNLWTWSQFCLVLGIVLTGAHCTYQILADEVNKTNILLNSIQFIYLVFAIRFGIHLFCMRNIDKLPGKLDKYIKAEKERAAKIAAAANSNEPF